MANSRRRADFVALSHKQWRTRDQLYNEARSMGIDGRSKMTKAQLQRAVDSPK